MDKNIQKVWPGWEIDSNSPDNGILGSGSFGDVYRIRRSTHGITEYTALKVISIPRDSRELNQLRQEFETEEQLSSYYMDVKQSFENEYAAMAAVRGHANIVYCDDIRFEEHENNAGWTIYIKMELLTPMIKKIPVPDPEATVQDLGIDICRALCLCHDVGIIHRDIKPHNIFLSRDNHFKLGDFGIAKHMEGTQLGTLAGTQDYMAPEIARMQPYSFQADIYSLGLVMYWLLNNYTLPFLPADGSKPVFSAKMEARNNRLAGKTIPAPIHGSGELQKIVLKACAFDPQQRYARAEDMLQDLLALSSSRKAIDADTKNTLRTLRKPDVTPVFEDEDDTTLRDTHTPGSVSSSENTGKDTSGNVSVKDDDTPQTTAAEGSVKTKLSLKEITPRGKKIIILSITILVLAVLIFTAYTFFINPLFSVKETITDIPGDDFWTLQEIGYIEDPDGQLRIDQYVTDRFPPEGGLISFYSYKGEKIDGFEFQRISYLEHGFYTAKQPSDDVNSLSLITREGEELIGEGACYIEWAPHQDDNSPRYLLVYTAETETLNKADSLIAFDGKYAYTHAGEGRTLYTGYLRVYDTLEKRFVPNLPHITRRNSLFVCGSSIFVHQDSRYVLYNAQGQPLMETTTEPRVFTGYFILEKGETCQVYDENGQLTFSSNLYLTSSTNYSPYMKMINYSENTESLMDIYGNPVLEGKYVYYCFPDVFVTRSTSSDSYGMVTKNAEIILSDSYEYINEICPGYYCAKRNGKYLLVNKDGVLATGLTSNPGNLDIKKDSHLFVINNRSYDLNVENRRYSMLTYGMAAIMSSENGLYAIYDLFTGKTLLPNTYEQFSIVDDYLYLYRDGGWTIFQAALTQ